MERSVLTNNIMIIRETDELKFCFPFAVHDHFPSKDFPVRMTPVNPSGYVSFPTLSHAIEAVIPTSALIPMINKILGAETESYVVKVDIQINMSFKVHDHSFETDAVDHHLWFKWSNWSALKTATNVADKCGIWIFTDPRSHIMLRFQVGEIGDFVFLMRMSSDDGDIIAWLPSDLVIENILPRVPLKDLVALRQVSKGWLKELQDISSRKFSQQHRHHSSSTQKLLIETIESGLSVVSFDGNNNLLDVSRIAAVDDSFYHKYSLLVGSEEGLVCIFDKKSKKFIMWNPSTKKTRSITPPVGSYKRKTDPGPCVVAFGFNTSLNDFIIVTLCSQKVYLYQAKGSWESRELEFEDFTAEAEKRSEVFIKDILYWSKGEVGPKGTKLFSLEVSKRKGIIKQYSDPFLSHYENIEFIYEMRGNLSLACVNFPNRYHFWTLARGEWSISYKVDLSGCGWLFGIMNSGYLLMKYGNLRTVDLSGAENYNGKDVYVGKVNVRGFTFQESLLDWEF